MHDARLGNSKRPGDRSGIDLVNGRPSQGAIDLVVALRSPIESREIGIYGGAGVSDRPAIEDDLAAVLGVGVPIEEDAVIVHVGCCDHPLELDFRGAGPARIVGILRGSRRASSEIHGEPRRSARHVHIDRNIVRDSECDGLADAVGIGERVRHAGDSCTLDDCRIVRCGPALVAQNDRQIGACRLVVKHDDVGGVGRRPVVGIGGIDHGVRRMVRAVYDEIRRIFRAKREGINTGFPCNRELLASTDRSQSQAAIGKDRHREDADV